MINDFTHFKKKMQIFFKILFFPKMLSSYVFQNLLKLPVTNLHKRLQKYLLNFAKKKYDFKLDF